MYAPWNLAVFLPQQTAFTLQDNALVSALLIIIVVILIPNTPTTHHPQKTSFQYLLDTDEFE